MSAAWPEPGARVTWWHYYTDRDRVTRTGTVWDRAPSVDGAVVVAWVVPDEPLPGDLYSAIAVGKSTKRINPVHGEYMDAALGRPQHAGKGEAFSSNHFGSPLGQLAVIAERRAHAHRAEHAS